ncbi:hypothetical protein [Nonomuraea harbinensis]|uniref:SD-repeat containing protein B domain-containing protein n=1 Tax=Nonomuraea harbinensis TaxID=1286938 RepID=A0ABW1BZL9_9ACTN|nr:hypothetical protein [Nonomuraea harbinensis]
MPGHAEGAAPAGLYVGKQGHAHDDIRDHNRDYAFVNVYDGVVSPAPGELTTAGRLSDNVDEQGMAFNQPLAPAVDVFGYPAGPHPDGYSDETRTGYLNGITISVSDTDGDGRYDPGISSYFDGETIPVHKHAASAWTGRIT